MPEAYIVEAVRTPVGRKKGSLAGVHPADLGAHVLKALVERSGIDPDTVEDVIFGCVDAIGPQAGDIARTAWLAAGYSEAVPGVTVDRQCGSSQQAVHFAAQAVMSGTSDVVVAGGVQNMNQIPISAAMTSARQFGFDDPFSGSTGWVERYGDQPVDQFHGAELIARRWDITRRQMEEYALASHERALHAIDNGFFTREIAPVNVGGTDIVLDEPPRRGTTLAKMAELRTLLADGRMTAAVASQIADGAAALLLVSEQALKRHGLTPRARIHHISVRGASPIEMLSAPIPATEYAFAKTGLTIDDMDAIEINEAFAPVVLAWMKDVKAEHDKVNPNGGAIALGHPLGATGARLMTTLLHHLERTGGRYGLQTMCEGGGQANVTIIERLS
ncbi:acetyl-CoA C-acetyltransferase [Yinghuangia sp. ASG 101]|uniref:acetyl-CoA C-acetyltransferase n=1 Tax=Yinghuangia sp. ASG 101 TaxID=2896848 RepID=UPI001E37AA5D|nr:acetyl-CoA C-acetyltransferase [Yinghuangia sp. ASG 101]UGQ09283.1 acetyl-CoA C-acetyltransferase [Yinghuangia sp. ASG 101]